MSDLLSVESIKLFLNDFPGANKLLKKAEFTPERIRKAKQFMIRDWNESPPILTPYSEENFPYKTTLLYGVAYWLFLGQSTFKERNHLAYSSGGLTVDDDNQSQAYLNFANFFKGQFDQKMRIQKQAENINGGWRSIGSDYSNLPIY